jgi:ribosomal protein S26
MPSDSNGNKPEKKRKPTARFNDVTFINWSLTIEQKAEIKAWLVDAEEIDDLETEIIQENCKITRSYDDFSSCYTCSIVPTGKHKTNFGFILVGKGSTPVKAFKQAVYIHKQVFAGDWSTYSTGSRAEEMDD